MTTTENAARYPLQVGAALHVLTDGRISIYGSRLIIHADGQ